MKKFVRLFEDFTKNKVNVEATSSEITWPDVREALQNRLPFAILTFRSMEDYEKAKLSDLRSYDWVRQNFYSVIEGKNRLFPSVFILKAENFKNKVKDFAKKYELFHAVVGEMNQENPIIYSSDGSSTELGNEIVSSLDPSDMHSDDHYQIKATYYKFVEA